VTNQADAFSDPDREIDSGQCSNGAETFFDAVQSDDIWRRFVHSRKDAPDW